jgi:hypothetical protein
MLEDRVEIWPKIDPDLTAPAQKPEGRDWNGAPVDPVAGGSAEADGRRCEVEVPTFRVVVGSSAGATVGGPRLGEARRPS